MQLPDYIESSIKRKVEAGLYSSPEEAIEEAFHLLDKRDGRIAELRQEIQEGIDALEQGDYIELDDEGLRQFFDDVKARGRERLKAQSRGR